RALSTGTDGADSRICESEERDHADQISASAARRNLLRHLRRDDLPGTSDGGGEQTRRLLTCASGFVAARHGQERQEDDGERAKQLHRRLCVHEQNPGEKGERDL